VTSHSAASGSAEQAAAYREAISQRHTAMVLDGAVAHSHADGRPWTIRDAVEASAGERLSGGVWQADRNAAPPLATPQRVIMGESEDGRYLMHADPDLARRLGLAGLTADDARARSAERLMQQAMGRVQGRPNLEGSRLEGVREPPARPAALGRHGDGVLGSQVALCNARDAWDGSYG